MKHLKDRLRKVIVIGATPAGISAASKLGELGIPVTLVDSDFDLDKKLSNNKYKLKSGLPLNHAHRPSLIRILRNPDIRTVLPVEITSIKHSPQGFRLRMNQMQTFVNPDRCILCGRCVDICPVSTKEGAKAISFNNRRSLPGRVIIDKRRQPLCQENCPLGVNVQGYVALTKAGRFFDALNLIRKDNILPGICGRICTHPCENACRRGDLDDPIAIKDIKRFLADYELLHKEKAEKKPETFVDQDLKIKQKRPESIAIVGSGPSGLAAAADLARYGYRVTVFEKEKMAGGLLRYGIGPYRLPRDILDTEIAYIENLGVNFVLSRSIDLDKDIDILKKDFDAVILTTGTWSDRMLGIPGETLEGVEGCISFLKKVYSNEIDELKKNVVVIGDGNSAFDLARTLIRLKANVTIMSWFPMDLIPADEEEVNAAQNEGVIIKDSLQVTAFTGQNNKLKKIRCIPTKPGEPDERGIPWPVIIPDSKSFELEFDRVFVAVGQAGAFKGKKNKGGCNITDYGYIEADESFCTNISSVYAAGDAVSGPSSVVQSMATGRKAALTVHRHISGEEHENNRLLRCQSKDFPEIPEDITLSSRPEMPHKHLDDRRNDFSEVLPGYNESQVVFEAGRCLQCGVCSECLQCIDACGSIKAINHGDALEDINENAGVIIIADPLMATPIKGKDVIRAYGPKSAKPDIYAMIMRGCAAAAQAMALLGGTSQQLRGQGLSFYSTDPGLSPDIRIGIFVCRCNDSLGWLEGMSKYVDELKLHQDIVHAETVNSACIPEGSSNIIKTIREKGITRVVLASCVCCPLDFVCSACTDQRSRLKDALFTGTGINRSMVETCDLRGEVLRLVKNDPSLALSRFTGLINRSVERSRELKPLPASVKSYNFTAAVIGESESAVSSALTLAQAGFEISLFNTSEKPLNKKLDHPNIHNFEGSFANGFSGTPGNFKVSLNTGDSGQTVNVGSVIIDEKLKKNFQHINQEKLDCLTVTSSLQKDKVPEMPFFYPGATSAPGLFLADPSGVNVSKRQKGAAAAARAAAIMTRGPSQIKGSTIVVDKNLCRGCGLCYNVCPYNAISLYKNDVNGWYASVDEALCKGCGNCISVCPTNAADSLYRNNTCLEWTMKELLEVTS